MDPRNGKHAHPYPSFLILSFAVSKRDIPNGVRGMLRGKGDGKEKGGLHTKRPGRRRGSILYIYILYTLYTYNTRTSERSANAR